MGQRELENALRKSQGLAQTMFALEGVYCVSGVIELIQLSCQQMPRFGVHAQVYVYKLELRRIPTLIHLLV